MVTVNVSNSAAATASQIPSIPSTIGSVSTTATWNTRVRRNEMVVDTIPLLRAVTKKLWNTFCNKNAVSETIRIRPYRTQRFTSSPVAPNKMAIGRNRNIPVTASMTPPMADTYTSIEKYWLARSRLPSPSALETIALPPVPIIKPRVLKPIRNLNLSVLRVYVCFLHIFCSV